MHRPIRPQPRVAARRRAAPPPAKHNEAQAVFVISIAREDIIEDNARDRADPRYGDSEWLAEMVSLGMLTKAGEITGKGWKQLNKDIGYMERNSLAWLRSTFSLVRDSGHDRYGDLVGSVWFDPKNPEHAYLVDLASHLGRNERIDMADSSYGDLAHTAFDGVSDFGGAVLGGSINFVGVEPASAWETIEATIDAEYSRSRKSSVSEKLRARAPRRTRAVVRKRQ